MKLHKTSIVFKQKVEESEREVKVIRQQQIDAQSQRIKIEHERQITKAKAQELSIASAKARAQVEVAYRKMVLDNNKVCQKCALGRQKVVARKAEIDKENAAEAEDTQKKKIDVAKEL